MHLSWWTLIFKRQWAASHIQRVVMISPVQHPRQQSQFFFTWIWCSFWRAQGRKISCHDWRRLRRNCDGNRTRWKPGCRTNDCGSSCSASRGSFGWYQARWHKSWPYPATGNMVIVHFKVLLQLLRVNALKDHSHKKGTFFAMQCTSSVNGENMAKAH